MNKHALRTHFESLFPDEELRRWFDPLNLSVMKADRKIVVGFPHGLFANWFAQNAQAQFEEQLASLFGGGYTIEYDNIVSSTTSTQTAPVETKKTEYPYGQQFTFDSFLVNKKNYFPLASAKEITRKKDVMFNPFVVCGENGSGKTHILRAVANTFSNEQESLRIYLGSLEDVHNTYLKFRNDRFKTREHFFAHDVIIVDDFQGIEQYPDLQSEIIVLFNHCYDNRKQMIFGCSGKVTAYDFLDPTLKSRLEWGLIVNLKQPDLEVRVEFIRQQSQKNQLSLDKEQVLTLAQRFTDFRYLQGILLKIIAYKSLVKGDIGKTDFQHILSHTEEKPRPQINAETIIRIVARHFGLESKELKSAKRHQKIVQARQIAMYLCRQLIGSSYPALGRIFGGKDHSTALYAVNKIKELQKDNKDTHSLLNTLKEKCLSFEDS